MINTPTLRSAALSLLLVVVVNVSSQEMLLLHTMREVPQSGMANPAYIPLYKAHFNLILPNISAYGRSSSFTLNDVVKEDSQGSNYLDLNNMIGQMQDKNLLYLGFRYDPISFGLRFHQNYITLSSNVRMEFFNQYPKKLFDLITDGGSLFTGQEINFDELKISGTVWLEHSAGYARQFNEELSVGVRFKLLSGIANAHLAQNHVAINREEASQGLFLQSNLLVHTSYPPDKTIRLPNNNGYGLDFGISYSPVEVLNFSAGVIDLGRITWKNNVESYQSEGRASFSYSGLDLNELFGIGSDLDSGFETVADSLENLLTFEELSESYTTSLPATYHLGASYHFTDNDQVGAFVQLKRIEEEMLPSVSLMYHRKFGHVLAATTAISYHNQSFSNLGLGFSLNLGFFQMYALSGNVLSAFMPRKAHNAGAQFGFNFLIGRLDKYNPPIIIEIRDDFWD
jgi:hypothetical protein